MPKISPSLLRAITKGPVSKFPKNLKGTPWLAPDVQRLIALRKCREDYPTDPSLILALIRSLKQGEHLSPKDLRHTPLEGIEFSRVSYCEANAALYREILKRNPKDIAALEGVIECLEEGASPVASDVRNTSFEGYGVTKLKGEPLQLRNLIAELEANVESLKRPKKGKPITVQYDKDCAPESPKKSEPLLISDCVPAVSFKKPASHSRFL